MTKEFDVIAERLSSQTFLERVRALEGLSRPLNDTLRDSLGEARHFLRSLPVEGMSGKRVLEVGAGLGFVSAYLEKKGVLVEAVEPAIGGYVDHQRLLPVVLQILGAKFVLHRCAVHELSPSKDGRYDLVISHNVLEHMTDLERSFQVMSRLLAPRGRMIHSCPNYFIPYDPHYGVWLSPFFPAVTPLFSKKIRQAPAVWRSLNFITARKMRRLAARRGYSVRFEKGLMHEALVRTETDPAFAVRQKGWPRTFHRWLRNCGLLWAVRSLPATWSTPMK